MYRHRPAVPAFVGACAVLIIGLLIICALKPRVDGGELSSSTILLTGCCSLCLAAMCIVAAFARYQFTHLWKHPDPAFSKKAAKKRNNGIL
jgi:uncharacterized membrane protein YphA (DoxX/SURF4 family)